MLYRLGHSFETVNRICNARARDAYEAAIAQGKSVEQAQAAAHAAYAAEFAWFERI